MRANVHLRRIATRRLQMGCEYQKLPLKARRANGACWSQAAVLVLADQAGRATSGTVYVVILFRVARIRPRPRRYDVQEMSPRTTSLPYTAC